MDLFYGQGLPVNNTNVLQATNSPQQIHPYAPGLSNPYLYELEINKTASATDLRPLLFALPNYLLNLKDHTPESVKLLIKAMNDYANGHKKKVEDAFNKAAQPVYNEIYVSRTFGKQKHPIHEDIRPHKGIDIAGPVEWVNGNEIRPIEGTPISSIENGIISNTGYDKDGYGNYIEIKSTDAKGNVFYTKYAHMRDSSSFNIGDSIFKGNIIGKVGSTGGSTGAHLHFEFLDKNKNPDNPNHYELNKRVLVMLRQNYFYHRISNSEVKSKLFMKDFLANLLKRVKLQNPNLRNKKLLTDDDLVYISKQYNKKESFISKPYYEAFRDNLKFVREWLK